MRQFRFRQSTTNRYQSIPIYLSIGIDNRYISITTRIFAIDWSSIININRLIDIDWYRLISIVIDYRFHRLDTPGFTHVKPVLGYVRAHEKFRDSSMLGWRRYFGISNERWRPKLKRKCPFARPNTPVLQGMLLLNLMFTLLQGPGFHSGHSPRLHLAILCGLLLLSQRVFPPSHCTVRRLKPSPQVFEHCKQRKTHENAFVNAQQ